MSHSHFFIAGAQRSGTTVLAETLSMHPEIAMAQPLYPEPKYFLPEKRAHYSLEEYLAIFFEYRCEKKVLGEKSVSYFETSGVAELIHQHLPDARFIFILRDPVSRAISNFNFSVRHGFEKRTLMEVFETMEDRAADEKELGLSASPFAYLARGLYAGCLAPFERVFGRDSIFILIQELWVAEDFPLAPLLTFLNVDTSAQVDLREGLSWKSAADAVPEDLRLRLAGYYQSANDALRKRYQTDLSLWTKA